MSVANADNRLLRTLIAILIVESVIAVAITVANVVASFS